MPADLPTLQRSPMPRQRLSSTGITEYLIGTAISVRFDAHELHHLAPLLRFVGDELAEVGRGAGKHRAAQLRKSRLHLGIVESRVDLLVELVDDFGRRGLRCAEAVPNTPLVPRQE